MRTTLQEKEIKNNIQSEGMHQTEQRIKEEKTKIWKSTVTSPPGPAIKAMPTEATSSPHLHCHPSTAATTKNDHLQMFILHARKANKTLPNCRNLAWKSCLRGTTIFIVGRMVLGLCGPSMLNVFLCSCKSAPCLGLSKGGHSRTALNVVWNLIKWWTNIAGRIEVGLKMVNSWCTAMWAGIVVQQVTLDRTNTE